MAFCLPLLLFAYWGLVGYAILSVLRSQRNLLQNLLLAPVIGLSATLLPLFWLNRAGIPILHFGMILFLTLLFASIAILGVRRPRLPLKHYLPFLSVMIIALFVAGQPLLQFGFHWVSYANDDMANYCLAALRFLHHGYFEIPTLRDLLEAKDYSLFYWFRHVPDMERAGSELVLAWVSSMTHLPPLQIFMPLIITGHLILISTTGALLYTSKSQRYIALTTCLLLTFSALSILGVMYQLIAQVIGLGLTIASMILIFHPYTFYKKSHAFSLACLITLTLSALFITYPELAPFFALSFILYIILQYCKGWRTHRLFWMSLALTILFIILALNVHLLTLFKFLVIQLTKGITAKYTAIFPYYLLPVGFANLWGLQPLSVFFPEPFMSLTIVIGIVLTIFTIIASIRLAWRHASPAATMVLVMFSISILLFRQNSGFGLFKLAMYLQPFMLSVMSLAIFQLIKKNGLRALIIFSLIGLNLYSIHTYVTRSQAQTPGALTEIPYGSSTKINQELAQLTATLPQDAILISNDWNVSILKYQMQQSHAHRFIPLLSNAIGQIIGIQENQIVSAQKFFNIDIGVQLSNQYRMHVGTLRHFQLNDSHRNSTEFLEMNICPSHQNCEKNTFLIEDSAIRSVFNLRHFPTYRHNFILTPLSHIHNQLAFIDSSLGGVYCRAMLGLPIDSISIFNIENDIMYPHHIMQSIGRTLLFRVLNPTQPFRITTSITNTFDGDKSNQLPKAVIIGETHSNLPIMGRGSARIFSHPLSPQIINNIPYIVIDMNTDGKKLRTQPKHGFMKLYGKNLTVDNRTITTFARDISLVSENEYQNLTPPSLLKSFPADLANPDLEYSGMYEDGWISEEAFFNLKQSAQASHLIIQGMLPNLNLNRVTQYILTHPILFHIAKLLGFENRFANSINSMTLTVLLDEKKRLEQTITPGNFEISIPVSGEKIGRKKVELHFSSIQHLPQGDDRPVAALIKQIGFV